MIIKKFQVGLYSPLLGLCAIALVNIATPQARAEQPILDNLVQQAASKDQATSQQAIAKLRKYKNAGVEAFWKTYEKDLPNNSQLRATLDAICQQKDCDA
ncbi:MAG: hypothetical protein ACK46E_03720, partial [Pseudanabaena sp.]